MEIKRTLPIIDWSLLNEEFMETCYNTLANNVKTKIKKNNFKTKSSYMG